MGTLRFFEEVVSFKIRRTFGFADYRTIRPGMGTDRLVPGDPLIRRIRTEILDGTSDKKAEIQRFRLSLYIA